MTKLILRPYQQECLDKVVSEARKGALKQVMVLATGLGKTIIFGHLPTLVKDRSGKKTLILAHREELLDQAKDKLDWIDPDLKVGLAVSLSVSPSEVFVTIGTKAPFT